MNDEAQQKANDLARRMVGEERHNAVGKPKIVNRAEVRINPCERHAKQSETWIYWWPDFGDGNVIRVAQCIVCQEERESHPANLETPP